VGRRSFYELGASVALLHSGRPNRLRTWRAVLTAIGALVLDVTLAERARAAEVCAWVVESVDSDGAHTFELNLSADAPTSVAARFEGPNFTSGSMGGDMIDLSPGEPKDVDGEGFDVLAGEDLRFDVQLFDHPLASLEEMEHPTRAALAEFVFERKVGEDERTPPPILSSKQCKRL